VRDLSVVLPVHNEADNLEPLLARVQPVLRRLGCRYEVILVDDGSTDESPAVMERLAITCPAK